MTVALMLSTALAMTSCEDASEGEPPMEASTIDERCDGPAETLGVPVASYPTTIHEVRDWVDRDDFQYGPDKEVLLCWYDQPANGTNAQDAERTAAVIDTHGWAGVVSGPRSEIPIERP